MTLFVSHLWSSTIFLVAVLAAIFAGRRHLTAGARFTLAFLGIVKFALPGALIAPLLTRPAPAPFRLPLQVLSGSFAVQTPSIAGARWPAIAIALWLAVALALIVRDALTHRRLLALALRTASPPHPREVEALTRARRGLGLRQAIDIARCALPEAPAVLRVIRPVIVLPDGRCDELSDDELESLLAHECVHVARRDNLLARIESFICALFWFHPLIWIAQRITVIERERACDEVVAGSADGRDAYLAALAKFCQATIAPRLPGVSCMATANLKERMDHVMDYPDLKARAVSPRRVLFLAAAALILFTALPAVTGRAAEAKKFTGEKITLDLRDADLRDVIKMFGKLTGNEMRIDDDVQGKVTVAWKNVPWDEAFDTLMTQHGLTYRIEDKTIFISKK